MLKVVSVMMLALLLAACGGNAPETQAPGTTGDSANPNTGQTTNADGSVTFGTTGQMFVVSNVPEGWNVADGTFGNGKVAVSAAETSLGTIGLDTFINAAASALGTVELVPSNGRTIYRVTGDSGVTMWVSPDNTNIITIMASPITDSPANYMDQLLVIAGSINRQ